MGRPSASLLQRGVVVVPQLMQGACWGGAEEAGKVNSAEGGRGRWCTEGGSRMIGDMGVDR